MAWTGACCPSAIKTLGGNCASLSAMNNDPPLVSHIRSVPQMIKSLFPHLTLSCQLLAKELKVSNLKQVYLVGCGDSHHAAVAAALSWQELAGINCIPLTSMALARFQARSLSEMGNHDEMLVIAISVSGQVSRTIEAARVARHVNIPVIAITANPESPLGNAADAILEIAVQRMPEDDPNIIVPGARSYVASLLGLMILAIAVGQELGNCSLRMAEDALTAIDTIPDQLSASIDSTRSLAQKLSGLWHDADHFVFCGAGPNYGTALFNAAKIVEASGDIGIGQDLEEWAHLNYFGRRRDTPTVVFSSGCWDQDRALEIAVAAKVIGRRLMIVAPKKTKLAGFNGADLIFAFNDDFDGWITPLLTFVPGIMLAAYRARDFGEAYFRDFRGGRSFEGGGGISRIRTSHLIELPPADP